MDNGRTETIKKLERLFTEFWKLNEPGMNFFISLAKKYKLLMSASKILCLENVTLSREMVSLSFTD